MASCYPTVPSLVSRANRTPEPVEHDGFLLERYPLRERAVILAVLADEKRRRADAERRAYFEDLAARAAVAEYRDGGR